MIAHSQTHRSCDSVRIVRYRYPYLSITHPSAYLTVGAMDDASGVRFEGQR